MIRIGETSRLGRALLAAGAAVTALTLAAQLYLAIATVSGLGHSIAFGVFVFFNYFTILTNIWLAVTLLSAPIRPDAWLARPRVQAALLVSLLHVCWIYALVFRPYYWDPAGAQWHVDVVLHYVTPLMMAGYWLWFVPKGHLRWRDAALWTLYPLTYFVLSQAVSAASGFYPYPFLDVHRMGVLPIAAAGVGLGAVFYTLSLGLIAVDRRLGRVR